MPNRSATVPFRAEASSHYLDRKTRTVFGQHRKDIVRLLLRRKRLIEYQE
jgi:hypothetical protein